MTKEMLGGCCVCSDESGWTENPLVYCDGEGCNVAVHQACYGIVAVPKGSWFCRKCESQERAARVRCELCPSKDGALKRTDNNGWAHVVCALYIPEVRFGNVTTMEPIILTLIPPERFNRSCYICQEHGKATKSTSGACMQCNKPGCKQQFHVTCAQAVGLLCEEAGNYMDNVKYCGYCQHHYSKLRKGGNVKTIPPYKPIATLAEHDSSPEKEGEMGRSSAKKKSYLAVKATTSAGLKAKGDDEGAASVYSMDTSEDSEVPNPSVTLKIGTTTSHPADTNKFTTSNFVETVVTPSEPVFADKPNASPDAGKGKKRKSSGAGVKTDVADAPPTSVSVSTIVSSNLQTKNLSVNVTNMKNFSSPTVSAKASPTIQGPPPKTNLAVYGTGTKITIAASREEIKKPKQEVVQNDNSPADKKDDVIGPTAVPETVAELQAGKRSRSSSVEKGRKPKKTPSKRAAGVKEELESPPGSPDASRSRKKTVIKEEKDTKPVVTTMNVPHMLGNLLNPSSSMAVKMHDSLNQEVEAHSIFSQEPNTSLVGPPLSTKMRGFVSSEKTATLNAANSLLSLGNSSTGSIQPMPLESLLERQWEQGSQFLMEQAQNFDIASLLSCLHQLKTENQKLEEHVNSLLQRRDHLLAVNARLQIPINNVAAPAAGLNDSPQEAPPPRQNGVVTPSGTEGPHAYSPAMHARTMPQQSPNLRGPMPQPSYSQAGRRPVVPYQNFSNQQQQQQQQMSSVSSAQMGVHQQM